MEQCAQSWITRRKEDKAEEKRDAWRAKKKPEHKRHLYDVHGRMMDADLEQVGLHPVDEDDDPETVAEAEAKREAAEEKKKKKKEEQERPLGEKIVDKVKRANLKVHTSNMLNKGERKVRYKVAQMSKPRMVAKGTRSSGTKKPVRKGETHTHKHTHTFMTLGFLCIHLQQQTKEKRRGKPWFLEFV